MRTFTDVQWPFRWWGENPPRHFPRGAHRFLLATAIALIVAVWIFWICSTSMGTFDFSTYYAAASALRSNPHADIYSPVVLIRSGKLGHVSSQPPLPFAYPPLAALLVEPLTLFPFGIAAHIWLALNATLWLTSSLILCAEVYVRFAPRQPVADAARATGRLGSSWASWVGAEPQRLILFAVSMLVCLAWGPAVYALSFGQIDFVVLLLLVLVFPLLRTQHDPWAGIAIGLAAMVKLTPIVLLLYLALVGRWRAAASGLLTLVLLALVTVAIVGPQTSWAAVPQILQVSAYDASLPSNEALLGAVTHAFVTAVPALAGEIYTVEHALLAAMAAALGVMVWRRHQFRSRAAPAASNSAGQSYALALCAMVLISPLAWEHHYLWVLPAAVLVLAAAVHDLWAIASAEKPRGVAMRLGFAVAAIVLVGALRTVGWDRISWLVAPTVAGQPLGVWLHELPSIGAVLLLIMGAIPRQPIAMIRGPGPPSSALIPADSPARISRL